MPMLPSVLNVNNFHYIRGGSDKYFLELTRLLEEKGHRVGTFTSLSERDIERQWVVGEQPRAVDTTAVGFKNPLKFLYSFKAKAALGRTLEAFRPDIAHLHIYYGRLTPSIFAPLKQRGIPIVQTLHEFKLVCPTLLLHSHGQFCDRCKDGYWRALFERCNRGSFVRTLGSTVDSYVSTMLGDKTVVDRYIAVSEYQSALLVRLGVAQDKLRVVYNYVDIGERPPIDEGRYFLYVGRLIREKGVEVLLNAYARLGRPRPRLVIAGDGMDGDQLRSKAAGMGLESEVVFVGHKSGEEIKQLIRDCICLINPSLLNETFGLTAAESLGCGRPVIVSKTGALPEVVQDHITGIVVPPGDVEALIDAMDHIRKHPSETLEMGRLGWLDAAKRFHKDAHHENIMSVYREVL